MDANLTFTLGPLQIPVKWLILFVALFVSVVLTERLARSRGWKKDQWFDFVIMIIFIFFIIYKFGWVISPAHSFTIMIATGVTLLYAVYRVRKNHYPLYDLFDFTWLTLMIPLFIYHLLIIDYGKTTSSFLGIALEGESDYLYHPVNWYKALWIGLLLFFRYRIKSEMDFSRMMNYYFLAGTGLLVVSIFDFSVKLYFGFTVEQWFDILLIFLGILGWIKTKDNKKGAA